MHKLPRVTEDPRQFTRFRRFSLESSDFLQYSFLAIVITDKIYTYWDILAAAIFAIPAEAMLALSLKLIAQLTHQLPFDVIEAQSNAVCLWKRNSHFGLSLEGIGIDV